ncbi:MAG: folylpolyglutamate synthase/dihydrofolate synthase family protein [Lawsonibacter sp.]|nr:folylpolyglutamate synthase/dihydrofolate synthase family protein [Lawsonibacter sp.]
MTGQEAVELIHQEAWTGRTPGLTRITELLRRLGDPHKSLKFVHITGTNGKGSTAAMVASVLAQAGLKTGLYTSPHLWRFHERFQVNGQPIPDQDLGRIGERVIKAGREMEDTATEFDLMTALGMLYFQEAGCDLVVLEVGLGGRLDATNVIPSPEVAVITNIGLEHTQELGNTRALIAAEKSGIIKPGCSAVLYHQSREVEEVVERACREAGVTLTVTAPDTLEILSSGREGQVFRYRGEGPFCIGLLGDYQTFNATVAIDIVKALRARGWTIPDEALKRGLDRAVWPARMELVRRDPDVILDGGHNPQCMEALSQSLRQLYPDRKIWFLTGVLADKDYGAMFEQIIPLAKGFVTITPDSPRAMTAQDLAAYMEEKGQRAVPCDSTRQGVETVLELASPEDVVCICGSLYMIGEVRHILGLC